MTGQCFMAGSMLHAPCSMLHGRHHATAGRLSHGAAWLSWAHLDERAGAQLRAVAGQLPLLQLLALTLLLLRPHHTTGAQESQEALCTQVWR